MDRCIKVEHARFHGGLHLLGFDTGQITAARRCALAAGGGFETRRLRRRSSTTSVATGPGGSRSAIAARSGRARTGALLRTSPRCRCRRSSPGQHDVARALGRSLRSPAPISTPGPMAAASTLFPSAAGRAAATRARHCRRPRRNPSRHHASTSKVRMTRRSDVSRMTIIRLDPLPFDGEQPRSATRCSPGPMTSQLVIGRNIPRSRDLPAGLTRDLRPGDPRARTDARPREHGGEQYDSAGERRDVFFMPSLVEASRGHADRADARGTGCRGRLPIPRGTGTPRRARRRRRARSGMPSRARASSGPARSR